MSITLDDQQQRAVNLVLNGQNVFLTGGGGTGKSRVLEYIIDIFKEKYKENLKTFVGITSTTGSSALLIGGTTIHSFSGLGVNREEEEQYIQKISKRRYIIKRFKNLKTLIIDEISMLTPRTFRMIYRLTQIVRKNNSPFGGIQVILSGDFCQLGPILEQHILHHALEYCFETPEWDASNIQIVHFKKIHRQSDIVFIETLQKIRMGISDQDTTSVLINRFRKELDNPYGIEPVQLFPTREKANEVNQRYFREINSEKEIKSYSLKISIETSSEGNNPLSSEGNNPLSSEGNNPDIERKIKAQLPIDDTIQLCIGCQVILVVNLSVEEGLVNGSHGRIQSFNENGEPVVIFSNGKIKNIAIYTWDIDEGIGSVSASGLPLILGYGCTIHRSQGMSLDLAIVDIGKNVFTGSGGYGQIYVALSRVRSLEGLSILNFDPTRIKCHPKVIEFYNNIDRPPAKNISKSSSISTESEISLESDSFVIKVSKRSIDKIQETPTTKVKYNKGEKPDIRKYFTTLN
jgi:ATP-dependent DNA helicase PIF1